MFRGIFLALGIFAVILGLEALAVESTVLRIHGDPVPVEKKFYQFSQPKETVTKPIVFKTPDWAPWILMGGGMITILYTFTLPKRLFDS